MIPISDDPGRRGTMPVINTLILGANIAVFVYQFLLLPPLAAERFLFQNALIPARLSANPLSVDAWLTVFTAMFMHGNLIHIASNMLYLYIFGDNIEDAMGHVGYLVFYLVCGVLATIAQVMVDPRSTVPNVGASGAIAGVLGAYLLLFPHARVKTVIFLGIIPFFPTFAAVVVIGFWAVVQFLSGFSTLGLPSEGGGVAYFAHIGGFVAGLVLARVFARNLGRAREHIPMYGAPRSSGWR